MQFLYENRFTCFLDILGFSELMSQDHTSERYAKAIFDIISLFLREEGGFLIAAHIKDGNEMEFEFYRPFGSDTMVTTISDAIVLSVSEFSEPTKFYPANRMLPILSMIESISDMQATLSALGVLSRGGLALGRLFHGRDIILGQGLLRAYLLESRLAKYPRTIIDDQIIKILMEDEIPRKIAGFRNRIANRISVDLDGKYFINYFGFRPIGGGLVQQEYVLTDTVHKIQEEIRMTEDIRKIEKLKWFLSYLERSLNSYHNTSDYLTENAKSEIGKRYPRTFENMRDIAANILENGEYIDPFHPLP